jgi:hypothetical protein
MGRKSASGSGIRDEQPGSYFLELRNHFFGFFWVKILGFFDADPGSGMETVRIRDPGSGMEKRRIGIGSATLVSKIKKSKRSHKTVQIMVFLKLFLLNDRRIRIRYQEAQKHVDPVDPDPDSDPDPQHWFRYSISSFSLSVEFKHGTLAEQFGACSLFFKNLLNYLPILTGEENMYCIVVLLF